MAEPSGQSDIDAVDATVFDIKCLAKKFGIPEGLSKRQTKKLIKKYKKEEYKAEWRKVKREREKEKKKRKKQEEGTGGGVCPVRRYKQMMDKDASQVKVAVDVGFEELMSDADIVMLTKQLQRCYSQNRRAEHPLQFYITSFTGKCATRLNEFVEGHKRWDVYFKEDSYIDVFPKESIVFLCAESPNILQELDPTKVYIIGGLVDHNHHKGHCYKQAIAQGLSHAQLPIDQYVVLNSRKVLTINHVFEILVSVVNNGGNWSDALHSVLPSRKLEATPTPDVQGLLQTTIGTGSSKYSSGMPPVSEEAGDTPETGEKTRTGESPETGDTPGTGENLETRENPETGDTPGTGENLETGENPETGDTPGTGENPETGDTPGTGENLETGENPETGDTPETRDTLGTGYPLGHRYTAGIRIYSPDQSLMKEGVPVASDDEDEMMAFVGF